MGPGQLAGLPVPTNAAASRDACRLGEAVLHLGPEVDLGIVHDGLGHGDDGGQLLGAEGDPGPRQLGGLLQPVSPLTK